MRDLKHVTEKHTLLQKIKAVPPARRAFIFAFAVAFAMFLPAVIYDRGFFFYFGDFNVQQIPFYKLAHEAVRSGNVRWSFTTDLGANFIASYSFYLLFSPFFWMTLPFPTSFVPHLMAPLFVLKFAFMALTSFHYLKRFVKNPDYAVVGALLYAFSGYSIYNIFFNHFHDVMVFFPLLLTGAEELVTKNRRGLFAFAVAINCAVNYWFFIGEVVFVIIYVAVRTLSPGWSMTPKKFVLLALESVIGLMLAAVCLVPSLFAILGNPRTTADNLLQGVGMWKYFDDRIIPTVVESLFFAPEWPSRPNFFPELRVKWSSISLWLPVFSSVGTFAYMAWAKKSWVKRLIAISAVMALFPVLNSAFILFNSSYYARWFYMPVLICALATVLALENKGPDLLKGIRRTAVPALFITLAVGLTPKRENGERLIGLMNDPVRFWMTVGIAFICLGLTYKIVTSRHERGSAKFAWTVTAVLVVFMPLFGIYYIANGKMFGNSTEHMIDVMLAGREGISLDSDEFARTDIYKEVDNTGMYWNLPNIQAFHSIVPNSLMEFYPAVGVKRDVSSKPEVRLYALRSLLSVKWFVIHEDKDFPTDELIGFSAYDSQMNFEIYKNDFFLPMGFAYDAAFGPDVLAAIPTDLVSNYMMHAVYLEEEDIARNSLLLERQNKFEHELLEHEEYLRAYSERAMYTCYEFTPTKTGFTARSDLDRETFMFFSVPYEKGWSASVNGREAQIVRANIGFMAVRVPAGESEIVFEFLAPGLKTGGMLSAGAAVLLGIYLFAGKKIAPEHQSAENLTEMNAVIDAAHAEKIIAEYLLRTASPPQPETSEISEPPEDSQPPQSAESPEEKPEEEVRDE